MPKQIEDCIFDEYMPVNAYVAARSLMDCLDKSNPKANGLGYLKGEDRIRARKIMWFLNQQLFGSTTIINMMDEWDELDQDNRRKQAEKEAA
jgi:hypothetical protein